MKKSVDTTKSPNFTFRLTGKFVMDGWQNEDGFVLKLPIKGGEEIVFASSGKFDDYDKKDIALAILNAALTKLA